MKNKKIMVIATTDNMIWQFLIPHIKHMQSLGNEIECVCAKTGFWFDELKNKYGFIVHEIDFARNPFSIKNIKGYRKLKKLQQEKQFDLIYCQQPVGGLMGRLIGKKFKVPVIYTAHGFHFYKGCKLINKLLYKPVEKFLSKYTDHLITINNEDFEAAKKMKAKHVHLINGIGVDSEKFKDPIETVEEIKKELNLKDEFVVTVIAEFIKRKNYLTILKTAKLLNDKKVKFLFCGTGKQKTDMENLSKKMGLKNVRFLGYRKDTNKILKISNIFFLPSFQEGLTLSVIESMNYGLPCVVSDVRGNRDLIENNKGGFTLPPKDAKGFADKITILMNNKNLEKQFGAFNKNKAQNYTIEFVKKQLEEIYKQIK